MTNYITFYFNLLKSDPATLLLTAVVCRRAGQESAEATPQCRHQRAEESQVPAQVHSRERGQLGVE